MMPRPINAKATYGAGDDLPSRDFTTPAKTNNGARSSAVPSGKSSIGPSTQKGNAPPKVSGKLSVTKHQRQWHNKLVASGKKISTSDNGKEERTISAQERKQISIKLEKQRVSVKHCSHVLSVLAKNSSGPEFWLREEYKKIRESMEVYGVSTVICICESDPVDKINPEMVREYCYFATTNVSKMSNSWKRNMLYWWHMTNTYNI